MNRFTCKEPNGTYQIDDYKAVHSIICFDENFENAFNIYKGRAINKLGEYEDAEEQERLIILPCKEGDTVYKIVKFCGENTGCYEFYRPSVEFENDCEYFEPACYYDDCERCNAKIEDDDKEPWYCSLHLDILCEKCKERFAIQKDKFTISMARQVFNTPMFNENTSLEGTYYLSFEEAEEALNRLLQR